MLLQRAGSGTIAPSGFVPPIWDVLAASWDAAPIPSETTVTLGPATIELGHDDDEADDDSTDVDGHEFGWDNEHPKRQVQVGEFSIEWRPVTNGEFYAFWKKEGKEKVQFPASWIEINGDVMVCHFSCFGLSFIKLSPYHDVLLLGQDHVWTCPHEDCPSLAHHYLVRQSLHIR